MCRIVHKLLFLFLAILQFIAPLVHAHTHYDAPSSGLHIPGLEVYQNTPENLSAYQPGYQLEQIDSLVISIDTGFRPRETDDLDQNQQTFCLPEKSDPVKPAVLATEVNFSPHKPVLRHCSISSLLSAPRAPPFS